MVTGVAAVTVKTAEQLDTSQVLVAVQVTVLEPPHAEGAEPPLLEMLVPVQPLLYVALFNHAVYAASITPCV